MHTPTRRWHAAAAAGLLLLTAAGCGNKTTDKPDDEASNTATASTTPTASKDPQAEEKKAALEAYEAFWDARDTAYVKGNPNKSDLLEYTHPAAPAFQAIVKNLSEMKKAGTSQKGSTGHKPRVDDLEPKTKDSVSTAHISDCVDLSGWKTFEDGSEITPPKEQPLQVISTAKMEDWGKDGWRVLELEPTKQEC